MAKWRRRYVATCTGVVGSIPLLYLLLGWSGHDWKALIVCAAFTGASVSSLIVSRGFARVGRLHPAVKVMVISTGILATLLVTIAIPIAVAIWMFMAALTRPQPKPIEVRIAHDPWTGKLK